MFKGNQWPCNAKETSKINPFFKKQSKIHGWFYTNASKTMS